MPGIGTVGKTTGNWNEKDLFYGFTSFSDPMSILKVDLDSYEQTLIKKTSIGNNINTEDFITDQIWFPSKDGT